MRYATDEEAKYAEYNWKFKQVPWAAGRPGGLFDNPEDILWSRGETDDLTKEWFVANDIGNDPFYYCKDWTTQSYLGATGWYPSTMQVGFKLTFYRDDVTMANMKRQMDLIEAAYLPVVQYCRDLTKREGDTLVGRRYDIFEPDLSAGGSVSLFESDGTWLLMNNEYVTAKFTDRDSALDACRSRFAWVKVGESGRPDEGYDWDDNN